MDKFIIRLTALLVNIYIPAVLLFAFNGIDISVLDYIFNSTIMLGIILIVLSHAQGKYHCKWMRGLCYNSFSVPLICFIDDMYSLFNDAVTFILIIASVWSLGIIATIILAINHFRKVLKLKDRKNEIRRRNKE